MSALLSRVLRVGLGVIGVSLAVSACAGSGPTPTDTATLTPTTLVTPRPSATRIPSATPTATQVANRLELPAVIAAYRIWSMADWQEPTGLPERGAYDSSTAAVLQAQIADMQAMGVQAGLINWTGEAQDDAITAVLAASADEDFYWALQVDLERDGDPSAGQITQTLNHLREQFGAAANYLYLDHRPVIFVSVDEEDDGCGMLARWREGSRNSAYLVMQTFPEYQTCSVPPDQWIDLTPDTPSEPALSDTLTIFSRPWSNGDFESKRAALETWQAGTLQMASNQPQLTLVLSYNDWEAGTNIEPGEEWGAAAAFYRETLLDPLADHTDLLQQALEDSDAVLVGAGDVASCGSDGAAATAQLLADLPGTIFMAGDGAYDNGSQADYTNCFAPTWGQYLDRMVASPGERDTLTAKGAAYFDYFGESAGDADKGYYSFDLGAWHVVVLNSLCSYAGGCGVNSPQIQWLKQDLAQHPSECTAAIWHYPLVSSGQHGGSEIVRPFWDVLYAAGAEVVVNAHDQNYERFAPMNPQATPDAENGIREFVVGTGGSGLTGLRDSAPNSEWTIFYTYGVLKLTLKPGEYTWEFIPQAGMGASDSGSGVCHAAPAE